jgi:spore coat protein U-like protein
MRNKTKIRGLLCAAGVPLMLMVQASPASGQAATAEMNIQANVQKACTLSATGINFGTVNTLSATPTTANGSITVTCTAGTDWRTFADNGGLAAGARIDTGAGRAMTLTGGDADSPLLRYQLYRDAAFLWDYGNAEDGGVEINNVQDAASTKNGLPVTKTIYGKVFPSQHMVAAGSYTDRVLISLHII